MNEVYDDEFALRALKMSDQEFDVLVRGLVQNGLDDGDIGYAHWWNIAHNLKMKRMALVLHRESIKLVQEDPASINGALAVLSEWLKEPYPASRVLEWQRILRDHDWDTALSISKDGVDLRELSPCSFALPEDVRFGIVRQYYR